MIRAFFMLVLAAAWIAASVILATGEEHSNAVQIAAALVVGLPGAATAMLSVSQLVGRPPRGTRLRVKRALKSALVDLNQDRNFHGDISQVSMHVWVVPLFWRIVVPSSIRKKSKVKSRLPKWLRAPLIRFASYRLEYHGRSGISRYRMGFGLVGICAAINTRNQHQIVRFYSHEFQEALLSDTAWDESRLEINRGLSIDQGRNLARRYSQAAALVLQSNGGAPIGCVTLELPPHSKANFPTDLSPESLENDPLFQTLKKGTRLVLNVLT